MKVRIPRARMQVFKKPRVILTTAEREWLGATVQRRSDGLVGQVWALAPSVPGSRSGLWLVANGDYVRADIANVTMVQSRVDQLALDM